MTFHPLKKPTKPVVLEQSDSAPGQVHVFDDESIWALNAALAARRPLLVRGEPGVGKTQLAQATAVLMKRPFICHVVDAQTESRDLLWQFDAVQRLAEAQVLGAVTKDLAAIRDDLMMRKFIRPGPVWWALNWREAAQQAAHLQLPEYERPEGWNPEDGCVLLIDEIDKAESDVPNGLLQALGSAKFQPEGFSEPVSGTGAVALVVITTNEERVLPDAFLRRCLVLSLSLPTDEAELTDLLVSRAKAHFPQAQQQLLGAAAELLIRDRRQAIDSQVTPLPGQAEYLDLVRAVIEIAPKNIKRQREVLDRVGRFVLDKNTGGKP